MMVSLYFIQLSRDENIYNLSIITSLDPNKIPIVSALQQQINSENEQQNGYLQLLQQREEENRQEVAKLTSEIRSLKLQLLQFKSMLNFIIINCFQCV